MLRYLPSTGFLCLLCWLLAIKPATAQTKYEAEGPTASRVPNNTNTINGIGFAENLTQVGTGVTFSVTVPATGMYTVTSRYAAARAYAETMSVYVNGVDVTQAQFASTASWASWNTQQVTVYLLANTINTVAYKYDSDDSGWINLDYILVNPAGTPGYLPGSAAAANLPSEVGVDKFTGTATVDIPLYTIAIPGVQLPIALHYAATGVQVNDAGGEVGMNWSLQAGLSIQRQVRDLPDDLLRESGPEKRYGWLHYANPMAGITNTPDPPASFSTGCTSAEQLALNQLSALGSLDHQDGGDSNLPFSMYDTEPDIYTYAIPGYSGKFVFDNAHAIRLIPYVPVRIEPQIAAADALVTVDNSDCSYNVNKGEVTGFTITTPEGTVYTFNCLNRVQKGLDVMFPRTPGLYAQRQFWNIVTDRTATPNYSRRFSMTMTTGWLATEIKTPAAIANPTLGVANLATGNRGVSLNTIKFYYKCDVSGDYERSENLILQGSPGQLIGAGEPNTKALVIPLLTDIGSPTATVTLTRGGVGENYVTSLTVRSPLASDALIKSYTFEYFHTASDFDAGYHWYKAWTKCDRQKDDSRRSFLVSIQLLRGVSNLPLYTFKYDQVQEGSGVILPPLKSINKDYWGFANNNEASTGLPKLYIYPLLGSASPAPSAPYRLYPKLDYPGGGTVLDGADRRPTTNLRLALTGTLTAMAFPTGGKAVFEYEQHRFYDPVLQQTQPAGGLRIRTIRLLDPITKAESRRDYSYQTASGTSSGVLLHWPHLAFALPMAGTSQWKDVTVRSLDELAPDPFESRNIGYSQVTEQVAGKGQVAITFSVPAGADDTSSPADAVSGLPAWQRPLYGLARQASNNSCPSAAPLQAGSELYPFTPATNYDFCRGLPLTVQYRAEPTTTTTPGALVSQESYTYKYTSVVPAGATDVGGLRYEQFGNTGTPFYVYGKYKLLTDFLYTLRRQVVQLPVAGGATNQTTTDYSYTSRGQLASKMVQGSDGALTRTRYKYLADYAPLPTGVAGELLTMRQRLYDEQVSGDAVETISEFRPAGTTGPLSYTGATLQTFATNTALTGVSTVTTPTYPARLLRWQPAQPTASASYDSVRVVNNALRIPSAMREVSSVLATDASLSPLATRTVAGRQVMGQHLGYAGSLPLVQIANATAAEVIFSDFEAAEELRAYTFERVKNPTTSREPYVSTVAARTGEVGLVVDTGEGLSSTLPASSSTQYRLVFWAKAPSTATSTVVVLSGSTTAFTQSVSHTAQWQRYDLLLPANLTNPASYQVKITAGAKVYFDDVYLAPTQALVASTTYRPAVGKTAETDARGRTTYYEYGSTGDLALVRDHNQAIVHQYEKVIPGRVISSGLSYTTSGSMVETEPVTFTAVVGLSGAIQYKWDFGDGTSVGYPAGGSAANQTITHTYPILGYNKSYTARLYVMSQGIEYLYARDISIFMQPIQLTSCTAGVISVDDCRQQPDAIDMSCASAPNGQTTFIVTPDIPGAYTYSWESIDPTDQFSVWNQVSSSSTPTNTPLSLTVLKGSARRYRCRVSNAHQEVISEDFAVIHYRSCP